MKRAKPTLLALCLGVAVAIATNAAGQSEALAIIPSANARIRNITILANPIFNTQKPGERKRIFRLANALHIETQTATIRAQLLFAEGEPYSERALRETERNLRRLRFLREPIIRIVAIDGDQVDIEVQTTDVWSFAPTLTVGRSGGSNRSAFGIEDVNFLGLGKVVNVEYVKNSERTRKLLAYKDPNVGFSRYTLDVGFSNNSDGHDAQLNFGMPFYSLQTLASQSIALSDSDSLIRRYNLGDELGGYQANLQQATLMFGRSKGLIAGWTKRTSLGFQLEKAGFDIDPESPNIGALPANRDYKYPFVQWEVLQDDFKTTTNQDQIGRTEDEAFGQRYLMRVGYAASFLGNQSSVSFIKLEASDGFRLTDAQSIFLQSAFQSQFGGSAGRNQLLEAELRYFWRHDSQNTSYVSLSGHASQQLNLDKELYLGGDNGLRAYPMRFQSGKHAALLTIEQRRFTAYQPLKLFSVGAAVFADVGRVWGTNAAGSQQLGTLRDVGLGLRLGNLRSARANMLHLDISWPLDDPRGSSPQFSVETRTRF